LFGQVTLFTGHLKMQNLTLTKPSVPVCKWMHRSINNYWDNVIAKTISYLQIN